MSRELADGDTTTVQGSGSSIYTLKNVGGAYSCSCPAWRNQGAPAERRTCKHLRAFRGDEAESLRLGSALAGGGSTVRATPGGRNGDSTDATDKAPPLLLAHSWDGVQDLSGYWMSEKLDGVRAYWDGKQLVSRLGNPFVAPSWFLAALPPDLPLDGELFMGRRQFQKAVSVVRQKTPAKEWTEIHYVIFDAPSHGGPFEERLSVLEAAVLAQGASHLKAHTHERCQSVAHLRAELARVEGLGGEGLMLRKPGSRYEVGRS